MRRRATADPAPLALPCRGFRPPGKNAPASRVELLLLERSLCQAVAGIDQLGLGRVAPEAEADGGACLAIIQAQRPKHVAGPARTAGAGRAERESDVAQIGDQARCIYPFAPNVEVAGIAMLDAAVDDPAGSQRVDRRLPQPLDMIVIASAPLVGELGGSAK